MGTEEETAVAKPLLMTGGLPSWGAAKLPAPPPTPPKGTPKPLLLLLPPPPMWNVVVVVVAAAEAAGEGSGGDWAMRSS